MSTGPVLLIEFSSSIGSLSGSSINYGFDVRRVTEQDFLRKQKDYSSSIMNHENTSNCSDANSTNWSASGLSLLTKIFERMKRILWWTLFICKLIPCILTAIPTNVLYPKLPFTTKQFNVITSHDFYCMDSITLRTWHDHHLLFVSETTFK